jgi:hypothetical protein
MFKKEPIQEDEALMREYERYYDKAEAANVRPLPYEDWLREILRRN